MEGAPNRSPDFKIGTLVFAKMKGYPYWPGIITSPTYELKKASSAKKPGNHSIFFFGSRNYSWVEAGKLKLYSESKDSLLKAAKSLAFKKACKEIKDFIIRGLTVEHLSNQDPFDELITSSDQTPISADKSPKKSVLELKCLERTPVVLLKRLSPTDYLTPVPQIKCVSESKPDTQELEPEMKKPSSSVTLDAEPEIKKPISIITQGSKLKKKKHQSSEAEGFKKDKNKCQTSGTEGSRPEKKKRHQSSVVDGSEPVKKQHRGCKIHESKEDRKKLRLAKEKRKKLQLSSLQKSEQEKNKHRSSGTEGKSKSKTKKGKTKPSKEDGVGGVESLSFLCSSFSLTPRAESPPLDVKKITDTLKNKNIVPSELSFGFIGLGKIGSGLVKNLLNSKHKVTVWNRTQEKCQEFIKAGALGAMTPGDVVADSDVTYCCVSDVAAAKSVVFSNCGVLPNIRAGKSYVEMSGITDTASREIADAIIAAGGRYLEVRFQGSKFQAEQGTLVLMAAGDHSLYDDCSSCFSAFSQKKTFLGDVGKASVVGAVLNSTYAAVLSGCSEMLSLSHIFNLTPEMMMKFIQKKKLVSPFIYEKLLDSFKDEEPPTQMAMKDLWKDTEMTLHFASRASHRSEITANANEYMKFCMRLGYDNCDIGKLASVGKLTLLEE